VDEFIEMHGLSTRSAMTESGEYYFAGTVEAIWIESMDMH
jgi:hypothetical protein